MLLHKTSIYLTVAAIFLLEIHAKSEKKDSLIQLVQSEKNDSAKIKTYLELAQLLYNEPNDTAAYYYSKAILLSKEANRLKNVSEYLTELGGYYRDKYNYDKAIDFSNQAVAIAIQLNDSALITNSYSGLGNIYLQMEYFQKALENLNYASRYLNPDKNPKEAGRLLGRIGNLYLLMGSDYDNAENYYLKAIKYFEKANLIQGIVVATQNLGIIEKRRGNFQKAIEFYESALKSYEKMNNQVGIAHCLANIGNIHYEKGEYNQALYYQQSAIKIYEKNRLYNDIILNYSEIASSYNKLNNPRKAIENLRKAEEYNKLYSTENHSLLLVYKSFRDAYILLGDTSKAYKYLSLYQALNDTLLVKESQARIDLLQTQFNVAQKEKDIKLLTAEKAINEATIKRKNAFQIFYLLIIGFSLISLTTLYFLLRIKQKTNQVLLLKNAEILQQKEEIESQRDEIEAQREEIESQRDDLEVQRSIAIKQRDEIMRQKQHITDSISYAKHIQTALLPNDSEVNKAIGNGFVFFSPLDIVSGDFYWVSKKENSSVIVVADCTGHGVPGAFMSVMGINFLTSIVEEKNITDPGKILTNLNENVIAALSHADGCMQDKDGMDISLCLIDSENKIIKYACARNRILVWRKGEIIQLDADKYSIGKSPFVDKMVYSTFSFSIEKGDMLYLLTDGYVDQFGGPNKTKFLTSRFKRLLMQIGSLEPHQQRELLEQNILNWMGNSYQIDDMLIVGIRV